MILKILEDKLFYFLDADSDEDLDDEEDDHVTMNSEAEPVQHCHNLFRQEFVQQYFS